MRMIARSILKLETPESRKRERDTDKKFQFNESVRVRQFEFETDEWTDDVCHMRDFDGRSPSTAIIDRLLDNKLSPGINTTEQSLIEARKFLDSEPSAELLKAVEHDLGKCIECLEYSRRARLMKSAGNNTLNLCLGHLETVKVVAASLSRKL